MIWKTKEEKITAYKDLIKHLNALIGSETNAIANLSNSTALLNQFLPNTVFAGYYLFDGFELVIGPFQGGVSCVRIPLGKGVCGISAKEERTVVVDDVKKFENYISCDPLAQSEIVVPMLQNGKLIGVLDIDSSEVGQYDEIDEKYLEIFVETIVAKSVF